MSIKYGKHYSKTFKKTGFRSKFEQQLYDSFDIKPEYESEVIEWLPEPKVKRYTPDFVLTKRNGEKLYIEAKGYFKTADRVKHLAVKKQHPDKDIRFIFQNAQCKLSKRSKTTYAAWCDKHGFKWAEGEVPKEWLYE